ncbi:MAG: hypothetical protein JW829_15695 [Pirellulales bacterium]|nr:hypothetical protein [Pirellulales bacterium]
MQIIRKSGYARAGLVGNPSDGYGGKTISVLIRNFYARVILYEWENIELILSQEDRSQFSSIDQLVRDVDLHGYYGGIRLVKATIKTFYEFCRSQTEQGHPGFALHDRTFSIRYESTIPRQVGLAGSSAIIVATLQALMEFYHVSIPIEIQPTLALRVETEELGIAAGLQDRVIQVYRGLVFMDFGKDAMHRVSGHECGRYERMDPSLLPPLYIAYTTEVGEPTEAFHTPLRALYAQGNPEVVSAMRDFASYAQDAKDALLAGHPETVARLMDQNFDKRASICRLRPDHVRMVQVARSTGASAKFTGSGGAIIGTYRDETMYRRLCQELAAIGCCVFKPIVVE